MIHKKFYKPLFLTSLFVIFIVSLLLFPSLSDAQQATFTQGPNGTIGIPPSRAVCDVRFLNEEILVNPTSHSVQLKMKSAEPADLYVEYGFQPGQYIQQTTTQSTSPEGHVTFTLTNLQAGVEHYYRVQCKKSTQLGFGPRKEHSFVTLRPGKDDVVTFAYGTDSHILEPWIRHLCEPNNVQAQTRLQLMEITAQNMVADESLDFAFMGGDHAMTHSTGIDGCTEYVEYGNDTVNTQGEANLRYEKALDPTTWGGVTPWLPLYYVLGNHEAETNFIAPGDPPKNEYYPDSLRLSRTARLAHLPDPSQVYPGAPQHEGYFNFSSGNVHIIVLDLMIGPRGVGFPNIDEWTLDPEQLTWFNYTLQNSDQTWKIVIMEHLAGGVCNNFNCGNNEYVYARGSVTATDSNESNGTFNGPQAVYHAMMVEHGVDMVIQNHDHVATISEKRSPDNENEIVYVVGGMAAANTQYSGAKWSNNAWIKQLYDHDKDGMADYHSNVTGTVLPGYFKIKVDGQKQLDIAYIQSHFVEPNKNGLPVFNFTLFPDGSNTLP